MTKRANPPALSRALVQDNVPAMVSERLWIGSIHAAFNQDSMQDRGITHVLNASGLPATFPRQFTYFTVDIRDKESSNILTAIGAVNIFVEGGIEKGGVLVHCAGGRSRSAAFVVAFIMSTQGCSYDTAYAQVRRARPVASVNRGFEQQLRAYGAARCDVFAAHQMMLRVRAATLLDRRNLLLLRRSSSSGAVSEVTSGGGEGAGDSSKTPPSMALAKQKGTTGAGSTGAAVVVAAAAGPSSATGMPLAPRSPRGRGRSPAGGNPATSYWQRRGNGGGNGGAAVTTGATGVTVACAGKDRDDQTQFLPKEGRPTRFRLCRPGWASVQVIPPLKNLERVYACRGCGAFLLTGGHIIKLNIDLPPLQSVLVRSSPRSLPDQHAPDAGASPLSLVSSNSATSSTTAFQQSPPCSGGGGCSTVCGNVCGVKDVVPFRGRGDRRSPSPLSERKGQPRTSVSTPVPVSSGSPTTKRAAGARRRPPPPLRVMTTELGLDRPPVPNRWLPEGFHSGASFSGTSAVAGSGGGSVAEGIMLPSPLGFTPSPNRLMPCAAGRGGGAGAGLGSAGWAADSRWTDGQRNSTDGTVFVFESEDESSTVDPSERDGMLAETSSLTSDTFHSGGGGSGVVSFGSIGSGANYSGWEGAGGGAGSGAGSGPGAGGARLCRGRWKNAVGTPPNAALQPGENNSILSSRTTPVSMGLGMESVSPAVTPRSPTTPASCSSTSPCASDASFSTGLSRPQSAEKRQFLMRMNQSAMAGSHGCGETENPNERANSRPAGRWLHVDLLDWMGDIMAAPTGRIFCPGAGCGVELGNWTWEKPEAAASKSPTGPPLIRLDKALIKTTSYLRSHLDGRSCYSQDNTPKSSPKSTSAPTSGASSNGASSCSPVASNHVASNTSSDYDMMRRSSGVLESRLTGLSASPQQWRSRQEQPRGSPTG